MSRFPRPLLGLGLLLLTSGVSLGAQGTSRSGTPKGASASGRGPVAAIRSRGANPHGPFATVSHGEREELLAHSRALLGVRYRWAGESSTGVDCSGLVRYAFGKLGIDLPHNAAMLAQRGTSVPADTAQMQPGDLIVFSRPSSERITHVGIYMGEGMMVHASSVKKRVVEVPLAAYSSMRNGLRLRDVRRVIALPTDGANDG